MILKLKLILTLLVFLAALSGISGQEGGTLVKPAMMYADSTRRGFPYSKNPHVIKFGGRYLMYSSVLPEKGSDAREIEITESTDLIH